MLAGEAAIKFSLQFISTARPARTRTDTTSTPTMEPSAIMEEIDATLGATQVDHALSDVATKVVATPDSSSNVETRLPSPDELGAKAMEVEEAPVPAVDATKEVEEAPVPAVDTAKEAADAEAMVAAAEAEARAAAEATAADAAAKVAAEKAAAESKALEAAQVAQAEGEARKAAEAAEAEEAKRVAAERAAAGEDRGGPTRGQPRDRSPMLCPHMCMS